MPCIRAAFPIAPLSMKERIPPYNTDVWGGQWLALRGEVGKARILKRSYAAIWPVVYNRETTASPSPAFVSSSRSLGCVPGNFHFTTTPSCLGDCRKVWRHLCHRLPFSVQPISLSQGCSFPWLLPLKQGQWLLRALLRHPSCWVTAVCSLYDFCFVLV